MAYVSEGLRVCPRKSRYYLYFLFFCYLKLQHHFDYRLGTLISHLHSSSKLFDRVDLGDHLLAIDLLLCFHHHILLLPLLPDRLPLIIQSLSFSFPFSFHTNMGCSDDASVQHRPSFVNSLYHFCIYYTILFVLLCSIFIYIFVMQLTISRHYTISSIFCTK